VILSGLEIKKQVEKGNITIEPFCDTQVNPNSYNLRLHPELLVYVDDVLDMKKENKTRKLSIPEEGLVLEPGKLYLGRTVERTHTDKFVPMLDGRSSIGRLGIYTHVTAGFGDIGFDGTWTLEIQVIHPVRVYPNIKIVQISYQEITGEFELYGQQKLAKGGRYLKQQDATPSRLHTDY